MNKSNQKSRREFLRKSTQFMAASGMGLYSPTDMSSMPVIQEKPLVIDCMMHLGW